MKIETNEKEIIAEIEKRKKKVFTTAPMFHRIGMLVTGQVKREITRQKLIDKGALLNSINYKILSEKELEIGSYGVPYAITYEYGTVGKGGLLPTIVPTGGRKNMTIPFREYKNIRARDIFNQLEYVRFKGSAYLRDKNKDRLAYLLIKKLDVKARPYFFPAIKQQEQNIIQIIREEIAGAT